MAGCLQARVKPCRSAFGPNFREGSLTRHARAQLFVNVVPKASRRMETDQHTEEDLAVLQNALEMCVEREDFEEAAILRDRIKALEEKNPILKLQQQLEAAIQEERYADAATIRDELLVLAPPPPPVLTNSNTITDGIRVEVQAYFVPQRSRPGGQGRKPCYFFAYRIRITNESNPHLVKLVSRYWSIRDAGREHEVKGPGVVGEEPELGPGESFAYSSFCPLTTPKGSMEGHYEFYSRKAHENDGMWTTSFLVNIAKFELDVQACPVAQEGDL